MSGSYYPPLAQRATYIVTPADVVNTIVLGPFTCKMFYCQASLDAAFNGTVTIEILSTDGSFTTNKIWSTGAHGASTVWSADPITNQGSQWAPTTTPGLAIPFVIRIRVAVAALAGTAQVDVTYVP